MAGIVPNDKIGKRRDKMVIFEFDKLEKDKLANSGLLPSKPKTKNVKCSRGCSGRLKWFFFFRERELLSRIVGDPTVGSRQDEKESCSTRGGLCVGTGFKEFRQTP